MKGKGRKIPLKTVLICGVSIYAITLGIFVWSALIEDDTQRNFLLVMSGTGVSSQPQLKWQTVDKKSKLTTNNPSKLVVPSNAVLNGKPLANMDRMTGVGSYSNYSNGINRVGDVSNKSYREDMRVATDVKAIRFNGYASPKSEFTHTNILVTSSDVSNVPFNDLRKGWGGGDGDEDPFEPGGDEEEPGSFVDSPIGSAWPFLLVCAGLYLFLIYRKQSSKT